MKMDDVRGRGRGIRAQGLWVLRPPVLQNWRAPATASISMSSITEASTADQASVEATVRPKTDEAGIAHDSEHDGVVDFDETSGRFNADVGHVLLPTSSDSDNDHQPDLNEVDSAYH